MTDTELVITAPPAFGAILAYNTKCRMTLGVLVELIASSRNRLVLAAPFVQAGAGIFVDPLAYAIECALRRGVLIDLVSTGAGLECVKVARPEWANHLNIRLFLPKENSQNSLALGSHAKFCLADNSSAYIGSANLTGPGLSGHFEMGVLVKGAVAHQVATLWEYAIQVEMFVLESHSEIV
jgi:phosphatidylserine/phosphatidylglycerophosphate/cardiolipin synthase-like enzyme